MEREDRIERREGVESERRKERRRRGGERGVRWGRTPAACFMRAVQTIRPTDNASTAAALQPSCRPQTLASLPPPGPSSLPPSLLPSVHLSISSAAPAPRPSRLVGRYTPRLLNHTFQTHLTKPGGKNRNVYFPATYLTIPQAPTLTAG